jgi:hypothetical protein
MLLTPTTPHRWPGIPARRRPLVASTRADVSFRDGGTNRIREDRSRGIFLELPVQPSPESRMEDTPNQQPDRAERGSGTARRSRAAEYIAALYIALVLATPWLLHDAALFSPSKGVEIQMSYKAVPTVEAAVAPKPETAVRQAGEN